MSRARAFALASLIAGTSFVSTARAEGPLSVQKRQKFGLILITPSTSVQAQVGQADLQAALRQVFDKKTDFALEDIPASRVSDCQGSLRCMVKRVRVEYDETKADRSKPFSAWLAEARSKSAEYPLYVAILTIQAQEGQPDQVAAMLINTDAALRFVHENTDQEAVDEQILERAVVARTGRRPVSRDQLSAYVDSLVGVEFRKEFEESGNWEPFGSIVVRSKPAGLEVVMDDVLIGTTQPGETNISDVSAGSHVVMLRHPEYELFRADVVVKRGEQTVVDAPVIAKSGSASFGPRRITFWSGVGVATIGAVLTTLTLTHTTSHSDWKIYCIQAKGDSSCGSGSVFWSLGSVFDPPSPSFEDPNASPKILAAPLGYSLVGTGAVMALGSEFMTTDEDEVPWIPIAAGLAVGLISYGISAALNGESAFDQKN